MILAVDKCQSICFKPSYRITNKISVVVIVRLVWLLSLLTVVPVWLYTRVQVTPECDSRWPLLCTISVQGSTSHFSWLNQTRLHLSLLILYIGLSYLLPLLLTIIVYSKIYCHLYRHRQQYSHVHDLQKRIRKSDRETVRMLLFIVLLYALTWAPIHLVHILHHTADLAQHTRLALLSIQYLKTLFTCISPIIYICFKHKIREKLGSTIRSSFSRFSQRSSVETNSNSSGTTTAGSKRNSIEKLLPEFFKRKSSTNICRTVWVPRTGITRPPERNAPRHWWQTATIVDSN